MIHTVRSFLFELEIFVLYGWSLGTTLYILLFGSLRLISLSFGSPEINFKKTLFGEILQFEKNSLAKVKRIETMTKSRNNIDRWVIWREKIKRDWREKRQKRKNASSEVKENKNRDHFSRESRLWKLSLSKVGIHEQKWAPGTTECQLTKKSFDRLSLPRMINLTRTSLERITRIEFPWIPHQRWNEWIETEWI